MADEDKEKAAKLAAAKKRVEQLKKQKAKKEKAAKDKSAKTETADTPAEDSKQEEATGEDAAALEADDVKTEEPADETASSGLTTEDPLVSAAATATQSEEGSDGSAAQSRPTLDRELTESQQSRLRSESFKSSAESEYKKQAARIEQLEKENSRLQQDAEEKAQQLQKAEAQIEELTEGQSDVAELRTKAARVDDGQKEVDKLKLDIQSLERQNSQLQSAAKERRRTSSIASPTVASNNALDQQLAARTATIESLELEISNLRHSVTTAETANLALTARVAELETSLRTSEDALAAAQTELATLRIAAAAPAATAGEAAEKPSQDDNETRLQLLTADLSAAQRTATDATERAASLQKKIDTLTALHRDAEASRNKELDKLRTETASLRAKAKAAIDAPGSTDGEDEEDDTTDAENTKAGLRSKVRALEAEVFDLKRGVWREKRMELQSAGGDPMASINAFDPAYNYNNSYNPPMQSPGSRSVYDDVDLATPGQGGVTSPSFNRMKSSGLSAFSVNNVLSAFTAPAHPPRQQSHTRRKSSVGGGFFAAAADLVGAVTGPSQESALMEGDGDDDDFAFDEDAFRKAREDEDRKRLERVREVKRGLVDWKGWRVDMVDVCGGGAPASGVFDI